MNQASLAIELNSPRLSNGKIDVNLIVMILLLSSAIRHDHMVQ